jgi:DNA-binding MarR family transcriptional regulator
MARRDERAEEARELSQMLVDITEQAKADFGAIAGSLGLPVHLARAVVLLSTPAPMRNLADRLACDRSYITSLADQLEERGLVERVPGEDRRIKLLQLTDAGTKVRKEITEAVADRALVLRRLNDAQRKALRPLLEDLLQED